MSIPLLPGMIVKFSGGGMAIQTPHAPKAERRTQGSPQAGFAPTMMDDWPPLETTARQPLFDDDDIRFPRGIVPGWRTLPKGRWAKPKRFSKRAPSAGTIYN